MPSRSLYLLLLVRPQFFRDHPDVAHQRDARLERALAVCRLARVQSLFLPEVRSVSPRQPRSLRILATVLIATQVAGSLPVWASEATSDPSPAVPAPPPVKVNRTVPSVKPVPLSPVFSAQPTDDELFRARVFGEPMVPTGTTSLDENRALATALSAFLDGRGREDFAPIEGFLKAHPTSAWRV